MSRQLTKKDSLGTLLCVHALFPFYALGVVPGFEKILVIPIGIGLGAMFVLKKWSSRKALFVAAVLAFCSGLFVRKVLGYETRGWTSDAAFATMLICFFLVAVITYVYQNETSQMVNNSGE